MTRNSPDRGLSQERLLHLKSVIQEDIREHRYYGAVIAVARHGSVGLFESLGHADTAGSVIADDDCRREEGAASRPHDTWSERAPGLAIRPNGLPFTVGS